MQSTIQLAEVDEIIDRIGCEEKNIISILQGVQEHYRYLPAEVFPHIAKRLGVGEARLFSVATFYENFSQGEIRHQGLRRNCLSCAPVAAYPGKTPGGAGALRNKKDHR